MTMLSFKGRAFVENHHLAVPFHELRPVRRKGLSGRVSLHDNLVVHGDNLAALKALLPTYHGKVKCIVIDPPYNTGNEGWAYNDKVNSPMMKDWLGKVVDREDLTRHDKWCCMMLPRLKLLRELLTDDGAIFVTIDDNEVHRLRGLMDEVFGEDNFITTVIWQKVYSPKSSAKHFSEDHDYCVVYARNGESWRPNLLPRTEAQDAVYRNPDNDPRGPWRPNNLAARNKYSKGTYAIQCPSGRVIDGPPTGSYWRVSEDRLRELDADGRIWWGEDGNNVPAPKIFLSEVKQGRVPQTLWKYEEVGHTQEAKRELLSIFDAAPDVFVTPKPVRLVQQICRIATDKDSIVLDSFAGSGTTAQAVLALNKEDGGSRRFVLIECEDYADSITAERVRRVIQGVPTAKDETLKAGYGGTFSYFELGGAMRRESILDGSRLPTYEKLAAYIFFTATGEEFDPAAIDPKTGFIGSSRLYDVYLIYADDVEKLKNLALTLPEAQALPAGTRNKLVFAPTKYVDADFLRRRRIAFQQLPFEIYESVERLSP